MKSGTTQTRHGRTARWGWGLGIPIVATGAVLLYRGFKSRTRPGRRGLPIDLTRAVTIRRSSDELFAFWSDFARLPLFMGHLQSVEATGERRWHWIARLPAWEHSVSWDTEVVEERPGELIRWHSLPGGEVEQEGEVRFTPAPGARGTEVQARIVYRPAGPAPSVAAALAESVSEQVVGEELRRFKELMEAMEVPAR